MDFAGDLHAEAYVSGCLALFRWNALHGTASYQKSLTLHIVQCCKALRILVSCSPLGHCCQAKRQKMLYWMSKLMQERLGKACQIIYSANACWLITNLHSISSELYLSFSLAARNLRTRNERQCFTTFSLFLALHCSKTHHKVVLAIHSYKGAWIASLDKGFP